MPWQLLVHEQPFGLSPSGTYQARVMWLSKHCKCCLELKKAGIPISAHKRIKVLKGLIVIVEPKGKPV
jgi:hypothetical protein